MRDLRDGERQRLKWKSETLRGRLLHRFATDEGFKKREASSKVNRASLKGGCLHTGGSATIPKTRARMIEFSANLEHATQQAQEEGDESAAIVDPNVVWRQTLSEPYKNQVYRAGGFFASSLRRSGYAGSSASASSSHTGPAQQIDEVKTLRDTLAQMAQRDERTEEYLRRMEEMQRQMAAFYNPLRPGASATISGSGTSTAPPLPARPPPQQPNHDDNGDDNTTRTHS
ncbi:hypothetical protein PIB30_033851 [Stylosanthes scabra]|uniref:Uncharacterized protein n=1 Tax=Stylosanthes scabra TaxID=79078 RepID=A0ABU6RCS4_9FABA|nr:hypothetical protein [Stylosanthes scabra]